MTTLGFGSIKRLARDKFDNENADPMNYFERKNTIFGNFPYIKNEQLISI